MLWALCCPSCLFPTDALQRNLWAVCVHAIELEVGFGRTE